MCAVGVQRAHWGYNAFRGYNVCIGGEMCALEVQFVHSVYNSFRGKMCALDCTICD